MAQIIQDNIEAILGQIVAAAAEAFGPIAPQNHSTSLAEMLLVNEHGVDLPTKGGRQRQLRIARRGEGLIAVVALSPKACGAKSLSEAKNWANTAYARVKNLDPKAAAGIRMFVVRKTEGRDPEQLYRVWQDQGIDRAENFLTCPSGAA